MSSRSYRPRPEAIDNPGLSHGVAVIVGGRPASAVEVEDGRHCAAIHPHGFPDDMPRVCAWCKGGNAAGQQIAERIDYGPPPETGEVKPPPVFQPRRRRKAKHDLKRPC